MDRIGKAILRIIFSGLILTPLLSTPASAISAELAKKCRAMAFKTYPPKLSGSKSGNSKEATGYYRNCLANNGTMPDAPAQQNTTTVPPQQNMAPTGK
jgi:hypothetical protein